MLTLYKMELLIVNVYKGNETRKSILNLVENIFTYNLLKYISRVSRMVRYCLSSATLILKNSQSKRSARCERPQVPNCG